MGRKSNIKDHISSLPETDHTNNDDPNDLYRKRLRSWKPSSTQLKSNRVINDEIIPIHRSTMYTFPINLSNDRQSNLSNTILSESLTTQSAFYCSSISNISIQTTGDLNNNHVTTLNIENNKRKNNTVSSESLSSQLSQIKTLEILSNPNDAKNINTKQSSNNNNNNNIQFTYHQSPTKRSRISTNDSIITNQCILNPPLIVDDNTIDINQSDQQEPLLSSINNESLINNSNSMDAAVKMVQPIVDIIFNAFEDQLKNAQKKPIQSSTSNNSSISPQFYSPMMIPYFPLTSPTRPIVLHTVNFNIQLTTKQPPPINSIGKQNFNEQHLTNARLNENDNLSSISLSELKEKVISYILSDNLITDHQTNDGNQRKTRKLKRIVQLAAVGVSVLCGYLFL